MTATPGAGAHAAGAPAGVTNGQATGERASLGELFSDVTRELSTLVRQEVALAKAEVTQSATKAGKGAGMFAGAAVAGHFVLLFLSITAWWALGDVLGRAWAALIVTGVWAIIAAILAVMGRSEIKQVRGVPQTTDTLKQVPNALKGNEEITR